MNDNVALFAATLLHSATNTHFFHWSTDSFSKHMALGEYYDNIVDLTDAYVEAYMGAYDKITDFPSVYHQLIHNQLVTAVYCIFSPNLVQP